MAYLHIPQYELSLASRANLIPCAEHREIITSGTHTTLNQVFSEMEFPDGEQNGFIVIETALAITLVIRINNVIFISMRGTQKLSYSQIWCTASQAASCS